MSEFTPVPIIDHSSSSSSLNQKRLDPETLQLRFEKIRHVAERVPLWPRESIPSELPSPSVEKLCAPDVPISQRPKPNPDDFEYIGSYYLAFYSDSHHDMLRAKNELESIPQHLANMLLTDYEMDSTNISGNFYALSEHHYDPKEKLFHCYINVYIRRYLTELGLDKFVAQLENLLTKIKNVKL